MKKLLVVIDMQNDFIDGSLGTGEAVGIVQNVREKINNYLKMDDEIIFTRDTHNENYFETQEGRELPVRHCIENTVGWEISPQLDASGMVIIDKPSFGSIELADYIAESIKPDKVELIGLCTDICVISNALILKARLPETEIAVDAKCCAGVTPESHVNALRAMKLCQIRITNGDGII
jgi:nicotinamidase-related amidase